MPAGSKLSQANRDSWPAIGAGSLNVEEPERRPASSASQKGQNITVPATAGSPEPSKDPAVSVGNGQDLQMDLIPDRCALLFGLLTER